MLSHAVDQNSSLEFLCFVSASGAQLPVIVFLLLRVPLHPTRRCTTISKWHGPRREFASFCNLLAVPAFRLRSCLGFERLTQAPVGPPQIARAKLPTPGVALLGSRAWLPVLSLRPDLTSFCTAFLLRQLGLRSEVQLKSSSVLCSRATPSTGCHRPGGLAVAHQGAVVLLVTCQL